MIILPKLLNASEFKDFYASYRNYGFGNKVKRMENLTGVFAALARIDEAKKSLDSANENLAQAYADLPWIMARIIQDINSNVYSGQFDRITGEWLIHRVQEIRSQ
jgi:hypothetical protein